jgi:hypothetical protein
MFAGALSAGLGDARRCLGAAVARWVAGAVLVNGTGVMTEAGRACTSLAAYAVPSPMTSRAVITMMNTNQPPAGR